MGVDEDHAASLHPLVEHLPCPGAPLPQERDARPGDPLRGAQPSQGLVPRAGQKVGGVDDERVGRHGDLGQRVHGPVEPRVPGEGQVGAGLGEHVGAGRQCVACLRPQRICHKKVARQGASRVEELPSHRTRCDLPEHVLPGLKGRVDARWCRFVGAEEVGGQLVCQVISDLGEPSADHGSSQLDSFLAVLGESGS